MDLQFGDLNLHISNTNTTILFALPLIFSMSLLPMLRGIKKITSFGVTKAKLPEEEEVED